MRLILPVLSFVLGCVTQPEQYEGQQNDNCDGLDEVEYDVCRLENAEPPSPVFPAEEELSLEQGELRDQIFEQFGVEIADGACEPYGHISMTQLRRFHTVLEGYDKIDLINGKLKTIQVDSAPEDYTYGSRPVAYAGQQTILFSCVTSGWIPPGLTDEDIMGLMFYFSHELGHVLTLDVNSGKALQDELLGSYYVSEPGHLSPSWELDGDFITEYAESSALEDVAETFSFATHSDYYPYGFQMAMEAIFQNSPILSAKVLGNFEIGSTDETARMLVWRTPSGELYDYYEHMDIMDSLELDVLEFPITRDENGQIQSVTVSDDIVEQYPGTDWQLTFVRPE